MRHGGLLGWSGVQRDLLGDQLPNEPPRLSLYFFVAGLSFSPAIFSPPVDVVALFAHWVSLSKSRRGSRLMLGNFPHGSFCACRKLESSPPFGGAKRGPNPSNQKGPSIHVRGRKRGQYPQMGGEQTGTVERKSGGRGVKLVGASIRPTQNTGTMVNIPTLEELHRKAAKTRDEAKLFTHPDFRAGMLEVAAEYERLAKRAEDFEERARISASNEGAMKNWRDV